MVVLLSGGAVSLGILGWVVVFGGREDGEVASVRGVACGLTCTGPAREASPCRYESNATSPTGRRC